MLENEITTLAGIVKNEDLQKYAGGAFYNLVKAVMFCDAGASVDSVKDVSALIVHMPTVLFWDKMKRYIYGTFKSYSDQVKFAAKFDNDSKKYYEFVKKQVALVDSIDEDEKIDYFAQLTRCFLLCEIDNALYFKLVHLIKDCSVDELNYLKLRNVDDKSDNNLWVSILSLQGLFVQEQDSNGNTYYTMSDLGKSLKACSLNFGEEVRILTKKYGDLKPLPQLEPMTFKELGEVFEISNSDKDIYKPQVDIHNC